VKVTHAGRQIVLPSPINRSASRSLRMICAGVCLRRFIRVPSSPIIASRSSLGRLPPDGDFASGSDRTQGVRPNGLHTQLNLAFNDVMRSDEIAPVHAFESLALDGQQKAGAAQITHGADPRSGKHHS
jgi:hypothetical protein